MAPSHDFPVITCKLSPALESIRPFPQNNDVVVYIDGFTAVYTRNYPRNCFTGYKIAALYGVTLENELSGQTDARK